MIDHELTDPAGGALTITHDHQGVWITATEDRDEVTVGPFPVTSLTEAVTVESDAEVSGDLMDGGVTAAAIEAEVVSPDRARSLVQERDEAKAEAAMCQTSLRGQIRRAEQAEDTLLMVQQQRDHLRATLATTALQRDEADKRAATASPRHITAREHLDAAWKAAHVTDGRGVLAGDWFLERFSDGTIVTARATWSGMPSGDVRLVRPPAPSRPEGAEGLADDLSGWDEMDDYGNRRFTHEELDDLADHLAALGYRKTP